MNFFSSKPTESEKRHFSQRFNEFGFRLLQTLSGQERQNFALGPYSVVLAMSIAADGAVGKTQSEIVTALSEAGATSKKIDSINEEIQKLLRDIGCTGGNQIALMIGNMVMLHPSCGEAKPDFSSSLRNRYNGELFPINANASKKANDWISDKTKGKIKDLVPDGLDAIMAIIINAIYFKGLWTHPFLPASTADRPFTLLSGTTINVPMMYIQKTFTYYSQERFKAVDLPYGTESTGSKLVATIVLPEEGQPYEETIQHAFSTWAQWSTKGNSSGLVGVSLPRFKVSTKSTLNTALGASGIHTAFSGGADFSALASRSQGLCISSVLHQAVVEVNEEGTEAAAATVVMLRKSMMPVRSTPFICDRPFLFTIRHLETGLVLFLVHVYSPTTN